MNAPLPAVTIIIPARPGQVEVLALDAARRLDYPKELLELIVVRGRQPSVQRNAALREARGELVYFLDDDSLPAPGNLHRALTHFDRPEVQMVGGPNLCPPDAPALEQAFSQVMGCWLAFGPSRARYQAVGIARATSEKELILCNLLARRSTMLQAGGFDETLYPNEENALMDQLQASGGKLVYDPEFIVGRRPRPSWRSFMKMLFTYGRGRAEQFRQHPTLGSAPNFVPPLFCLYLAILPLLPAPCAWMLVAYLMTVLAQCAVSILQTHRIVPLLFPLIVMTHILYGLGFWRGLTTTLKRPGTVQDAGVILEKIST